MIIGNNGVAGTVYFNTAFDTKSYNKNVKNTLSSTENAFSKTFGKIGKVIAVALSVKAIAGFTKSCIDLGSDLAEVQNVVDVVFPNINSQVNNFAKNAINQFGLSELATKKYMGTFGAMSKSFGFSEQAAFKMSKTVTGLVGDVSSFYNISQDLAYTKLKSIWTGETETLKDLGVVMTQTALNEYALRNGFSKTIDKMTEAEKVTLRYSFVQDQLASATGDFARTSDGWANQVRVLGLRFDQLKASLGQGFINMFTPIVQVLNIVISKLQVFADTFNKITSAIFGKQKQAVTDVTSQYTNMGTSAVRSADDISKASKKVQKAVMGYDKLNILSNKKESSSGDNSSNPSGASVGTSMPTISTPIVEDTISPQMQEIVDRILSYIEPLKNISFDNLLQSLSNLKDNLGQFGKNVFSGLEWLYFNILTPLAGWVIEDALPKFIDILSGAFKVLNPILEAFGSIFQPVWDNLLKPLAEWTGGVIVDVLGGIADVLSNLGDWMSEHQTVVEDFIRVVGSFAAAWGLVNLALDAWNIGIGIWNSIGAIATTVTTGFGTAMAILKSPITLAVLAIGAVIAIVVLLIKHWDTVKEVAGKCWEWIVNVWNGAATWFNNTIVQPISNFFGGMWDNLKNGAKGAWEGIKNIFSTVASFFKSIFSNAWNGVKAVFSTGGKIFDGIKDGIVSSFKNIVNGIIGGINKVIKVPFDGINNAIQRVKGIEIMGWKPFDWLPSIGVPQIPQLAEGAWFKARNPRLAIVGEGKNDEIVAPEPKLDEAIERGFKKYGQSSGTQKLEIVLKVEYEDGKTIIRKINDTEIKEGKILLLQ